MASEYEIVTNTQPYAEDLGLDTADNEPAKADGQPDSVTRNVMPMATLQSVLGQIEERMRDLDKSARRSRKNKDYNWENVCNARILGLIDARNIVLETLEPATQHEGTKPSSEPSA